MKRNLIRTLLVTVAALLLAIGAASAEELTITHQLGEVSLPENPERVVVFDYGILDALDYAGIEGVVALPKGATLPQHLSKYADDAYVHAGSLQEPDFETLFELEPDVIFISARTSTHYDALSEIAPTVFMPMPSATYLETFYSNMDVLAQIFPEKAETIQSAVTEIRTKAESIQTEVTQKAYSALMVQANDGNLTVFGLGSRYALVYTDLGFNLKDESIEQSTHGQASSFEYIAEQNPQFVFVIDRSAAIGTEGASGAQQLLDNELINAMDAAKNEKIFYFNASNWYVVAGGIFSTQAMLMEVAKAIQ